MHDKAKGTILDRGTPFFILVTEAPCQKLRRSRSEPGNEREQQSRRKGTRREKEKDWRRQTFVSEEA